MEKLFVVPYLPPEVWGKLCSRIQSILEGTVPLIPFPVEIEGPAQEFTARIIAESSAVVSQSSVTEQNVYEEVDILSLALLRSRSVGVEHVALHTARQLKLPEVLQQIGCTKNQANMALANIIGRMVMPGSEKATWHWLTERSALGELLGVDFSTASAMSLYRAADLLVEQHEVLEKELFQNALSLFSLQETVALLNLGKASPYSGPRRCKFIKSSRTVTGFWAICGLEVPLCKKHRLLYAGTENSHGPERFGSQRKIVSPIFLLTKLLPINIIKPIGIII
ncbi:MAG: hypothetical protein LBO77_03715 [Desulfovibrio sp.]|nr:hypothetical protein [Desulfovibrio sp.]